MQRHPLDARHAKRVSPYGKDVKPPRFGALAASLDLWSTLTAEGIETEWVSA
jgi:hypothetical protein